MRSIILVLSSTLTHKQRCVIIFENRVKDDSLLQEQELGLSPRQARKCMRKSSIKKHVSSDSLISIYSGLRPTNGPRKWSFSWRCRVLFSSSSCFESMSDFLFRSNFFTFLCTVKKMTSQLILRL